MKKLKKIVCLLLCLALTAGLFGGCSGKLPAFGRQDSSSPEDALGSAGKPAAGSYRVGLLQYAENPWLDEIREDFMSRLEEWAYDEDAMSIEYQNARGDAARAETICNAFVKKGVHLIVAISAPAAQAAMKAAENTEVSVLFTAVKDPAGTLGIASPEAPEGNVTGVGEASAAEPILEMARKGTPYLRTLGLLYDPGDGSAKAFVDQVKAYCEKQEIKVEEAGVHKEEEISAALAGLLEKADAIYTPGDCVIAAGAENLAETTRKAKKPWYAETGQLVQAGALAAMAPDYTEMAYKTADMAVELMEGKAVSQIPVTVYDRFGTYINQTTAETVGAEFSEEITGAAYIVP